MAIEKPSFIIEHFRINKGWEKKLRFAGIRSWKRTEQSDKAIEAKHVEDAKAIGRDAYRADRKDATGVKRSDSGTPIWGWNPEGNRRVSLGHLADDIEKWTGYHISDIHITQKPKERNMYDLYITFSDEEPFVIPEKALSHLDFIMHRCYDFLHGFRNPNGSWTLNPSHAFEKEPDEFRVVRLDSQYRLYSEKVAD